MILIVAAIGAAATFLITVALAWDRFETDADRARFDRDHGPVHGV